MINRFAVNKYKICDPIFSNPKMLLCNIQTSECRYRWGHGKRLFISQPLLLCLNLTYMLYHNQSAKLSWTQKHNIYSFLMKCLIWCILQTWRAKLRNNQVLPYFLRDSVVLRDTEGATQQSTQYRLATEQWCLLASAWGDDSNGSWLYQDSRDSHSVLISSSSALETVETPDHYG